MNVNIDIPFSTTQGLCNLARLDDRLFDIEQISAALAKINRFAGRTPQPWSVAAHSLLVYEISGRKPWGLFHDAHETILGDATTPGMKFAESLSPSFNIREGFDLAKARLDAQIAASFGVQIEDVSAEDQAACEAELSVFFGIPTEGSELALHAKKYLLDMIDHDRTWQDWTVLFNRTAKNIIRKKGVSNV